METNLIKLEEVEMQKIISISRGKQLPKEERGTGKIIVIGAGKKSPYTTSISNYKSNTITISSSGAYAGYVSMHNYPIWASDCTVIEISNEELLDRNYLYLFLISKQELIYSFQVGAGQPHVYWKNIKTIEIPLPPLPKQKAIAKKLDLAQKLIELRKQSITKLDELAKSVFVEMFGDPVENEMGWETQKLSKFCDFENGDRSSNYPSGDDLSEEGIIFLSSREIVDFRFKPSNSNFITEEKYNQLSQGHCKEGDVLMTLRGNGRGKCCIFRGKYSRGFINAQMIILRFNTKMINTFFIELIRNTRMFDNLLRIGSGSAQPQITASALKAIPLIIPPLPLQNKFAKTIQAIEAQKILYEQELMKLEESFSGLLQESFA